MLEARNVLERLTQRREASRPWLCSIGPLSRSGARVRAHSTGSLGKAKSSCHTKRGPLNTVLGALQSLFHFWVLRNLSAPAGAADEVSCSYASKLLKPLYLTLSRPLLPGLVSLHLTSHNPVFFCPWTLCVWCLSLSNPSLSYHEMICNQDLGFIFYVIFKINTFIFGHAGSPLLWAGFL